MRRGGRPRGGDGRSVTEGAGGGRRTAADRGRVLKEREARECGKSSRERRSHALEPRECGAGGRARAEMRWLESVMEGGGLRCGWHARRNGMAMRQGCLAACVACISGTRRFRCGESSPDANKSVPRSRCVHYATRPAFPLSPSRRLIAVRFSTAPTTTKGKALRTQSARGVTRKGAAVSGRSRFFPNPDVCSALLSAPCACTC